jgi:hypothetical protein
MKLTKALLRTLIKEALLLEFELEGDFAPGTQVWWYPTERVVKTRASSGKKYIDYDRVERTGVVEELLTARGTLGAAIVRDEEGNSQEIPVAELNLSPLESAMVTA